MSKRKTSATKRTSRVPRGIFFPSSTPLRALACATLLALAVFSAYNPCISGAFVFDDDLLLTGNRPVRASDGLQQFWCSTQSPDYWPMTNTMLWIEWRLWELNPTGYHVTNLTLHIIESLLIWIILRNLSFPGAFLAAAIFALHPVNVESVAWIAARKNLTGMLFFLLAILWYLKSNALATSRDMAPARSQGEPGELDKNTDVASAHSHGGPRERDNLARLRLAAKHDTARCSLSTVHCSLFYCLSLAAFVLAMLGKGSTAVLPILLLGIVCWKRPLKIRDLTRTAPFFLIAALLTAVNMWCQTRGSEVVIRTVGFTDRILGAGYVVWFYLYKAILPVNLAFIYPQWNIHFANPLCWLPLAAALAFTAALCLYAKKWSRPFLFSWGFFCAALVPVMGFTDVGFMKYSLVADRYQHIAIIALIAPAAALWSLWRRREGQVNRLAAYIIAATALGTLALLTWRQSENFQDPITLYKAALQKNPQSWLAENNLGKACCDIGQLQEAVEHYTNALRLKPDYPEAHNNLALILGSYGEFNEAIKHYQLALRYKPNYAEAHNNLGIALVQIGRIDEAIGHYRESLRLNPYFAIACSNMGATLQKIGRFRESIEYCDQAVRLEPKNPVVWNNLGFALFKSGRPQEAIERYENALRLKPDYIEVYINLGNLFASNGRYQKAVENFRQVLRLKPDQSEAYFSLALTLSLMDRPSEAVAAAKKAIQLAGSKGQTKLAKQMENWLNSYVAGLQNPQNTPPPDKSNPQPPLPSGY
jgi:tetratricopeptide (TPR) repeat protein